MVVFSAETPWTTKTKLKPIKIPAILSVPCPVRVYRNVLNEFNTKLMW